MRSPLTGAYLGGEGKDLMQRLTAWWRGLSRRGKAVTIAAVLVVLVVVGGQKPATETATQPTTTTALPATAAPTSRPTVQPTATPEPTPIPTPEPTPEPFQPIILDGTGNKIVRIAIPDDLAVIATATYSGSGNFVIWSIAADGSNNDLLVNTIGKYKGTVFFDFDEHSVALKVEAEGGWAITVDSWLRAPTWDPTASLKSTGDGVFLVDPPSSGFVTLDLAHRGESNFVVWAYAVSGMDLLANEIGNFTGQTLLPEGTFLLVVTADGAWTATTG